MTQSVLTEAEAAAWCRLSRTSFRKAVKEGRLPQPPELGVRRRVWHIDALAAALLGREPLSGVANDREQRKAEWQRRREDR